MRRELTKLTNGRPMKIQQQTRRGQIIFVLALSIGALIGTIALCTDIGLLYYNSELLQKAADSAALAGAHYLPYDPTRALSTANSFALSNGVNANEIVSTTVATDDQSITISLARSVAFYFATVIGIRSGRVNAAATAGLQGLGGVSGMLPIGIDSRTTYSYGQQISLMTGQYGPGDWGPLALGGTGASIFASNIQNGYSGIVSVGQTISTDTGQMVGPTVQAFDTRLNAGLTEYPNGSFANHTIDDPRAVTVPMIDYSNIGGSTGVPVLGFAELWLVGMNSQETITAYFIQQVANGTPTPGSPIYGAWQVVLLK
jgi:Flp pilus assembly protein TadG